MHPRNDSLEQLHEDLQKANMAPTWKYIADFVSKEPKATYRPWLWRWDDILPLLQRAGDLITPDRGAERRSMEHVNPDLKPHYATSHTIATALQLVKAGERAPAHRHATGAIRFAAASKGGMVYTKVQGEKLLMEENDLILTPSWAWHEHANETDNDIVWLDALDFPLVNLLKSSIFEPGEGEVCPDKPDDYTRNSLGLFRPVGGGDYSEEQPTLRYSWQEMRAALDRRAQDEGCPHDGVMLEYINPLTSGPTLPTMSCRAQLLRSDEWLKAHRATASTVYYVIAGSGSTVIEGQVFEWRKGDVFVVPIWAWHEHRNGTNDAYLFSVTDRPAMERLGLYREEALFEGNGHQTVLGIFSPTSGQQD